jgi:hypothetical protein
VYAVTASRIRQHLETEVCRYDRASANEAPHWIKYQHELAAGIFSGRLRSVHVIGSLHESLTSRMRPVDVVRSLTFTRLLLGESPVTPIVGKAESLLDDSSPPDCVRLGALESRHEILERNCGSAIRENGVKVKNSVKFVHLRILPLRLRR